MSAAQRHLVAVYADESCIGNGRDGSNPGGAAGVVEFFTRSGNLVRHDYWTSEPATTNNRMALQSVIVVFTLLARKKNLFDVVFTSDSQYLINGMTEWVHGWSARGWRRKTGAIENLDLWLEAVSSVGHNRVQWRWVRGHDGHPQNAYADHLATTAAARQDSSDGLAESRFSEWLDVQREKRKITAAPDPFPSAESFKPARALPRTNASDASQHTL